MKIVLQDVAMSFAERVVLQDISLDISENKFTGIIGPNGSGKSTLLKCIYRVLKPDEGIICLDGKNLQDYSIKETAQKQAVLAQSNSYNFDFEVLDFVLMGRTPYKNTMDRDTLEDYTLAKENLKIVGMERYMNSNLSVLSGGEQQRVLLARALTQNTKCLLLDEPTNHLDIKYQLEIFNIIKNKGFTVVAIMHDLNMAAMYCDEIVALKEGKIMKKGLCEEIFTPEFINEIFEVKADVVKHKDGRMFIVYNKN